MTRCRQPLFQPAVKILIAKVSKYIYNVELNSTGGKLHDFPSFLVHNSVAFFMKGELLWHKMFYLK